MRGGIEFQYLRGRLARHIADNLSTLQHNDSIRAGDGFGTMRNDDARQFQRTDRFVDAVLTRDIEMTSGFVKEKNAGLAVKRPGQQ